MQPHRSERSHYSIHATDSSDLPIYIRIFGSISHPFRDDEVRIHFYAERVHKAYTLIPYRELCWKQNYPAQGKGGCERGWRFAIEALRSTISARLQWVDQENITVSTMLTCFLSCRARSFIVENTRMTFSATSRLLYSPIWMSAKPPAMRSGCELSLRMTPSKNNDVGNLSDALASLRSSVLNGFWCRDELSAI